MIKWVEYIDNWANVKRSARTTISKDGSGSYPTTGWKKTILLAEHSPIRRIRFSWRWENLKSWVSVISFAISLVLSIGCLPSVPIEPA